MKSSFESVNSELLRLQEEDDDTGGELRALARIRQGTRSRRLQTSPSTFDVEPNLESFVSAKSKAVTDHEEVRSDRKSVV